MNNLVPVIAHYLKKYHCRDDSLYLSITTANVTKARFFHLLIFSEATKENNISKLRFFFFLIFS